MSTSTDGETTVAAPRTLAEELRGRSDRDLAALFAARPDIANPPPADMTQVASRAVSRTSVSWAMDRLDSAQLAVLAHVTTLADPTDTATVRAGLDAHEGIADTALARLRDLALVWGPDTDLHVLREARELVRAVPPTHAAVTVRPDLTSREVDRRRLSHACAGTASEIVQRAEQLLGAWGEEPPGVLRSGGVGVRDTRAAAQELGVGVDEAEFLIDLTRTAGLLGVAESSPFGTVWAPTTAYDRWVEASTGTRWLRLVRAWLDSPGRAIRRLTLQVLGSVAPEAYADLDDLVAAVGWHAPRAGEHRDPLVVRTLREATWLGLVALQAATPAWEALAAEDPSAQMDALLPDAVDHVMLQADLTAVAPGPLRRDVAKRLEEVADLESRGGATVFRFTEASVRRALDRGWPVSNVHAFLSERSLTPVPQPLTYLVDDVARRHGRLRVGDARGYLRADDPAELTGMLADPALADLHLVRIAPTVALTDLPSDLVVERLARSGRDAAVEGADGALLVESASAVRAPEESPVEVRRGPEPSRLVAAVRSGDAAVSARPADPSGRIGATASVRMVARLRDAVEARDSVWMAYLDQAGSRSERIVDPQRVEAGWLTAYDHRTDGVQRFALHRITDIAPDAVSRPVSGRRPRGPAH